MEWWQSISLVVAVACLGVYIDRVISGAIADVQAKIDRIWEHLREAEERMMRHSDWNRAYCEKLVYDAERDRFYERAQEKADETGECKSLDDVMEKYRKIDEIVEQRYPKKRVEDFLE